MAAVQEVKVFSAPLKRAIEKKKIHDKKKMKRYIKPELKMKTRYKKITVTGPYGEKKEFWVPFKPSPVKRESYRIVAQTPEEASRRGFQLIRGKVFTFFPDLSDPIAIERISNASLYNLHHFWFTPKWGIIPRVLDQFKGSKSVIEDVKMIKERKERPEILMDNILIRDYVIRYWFPAFVLGADLDQSKEILEQGSLSGTFRSINKIRMVAQLYGIHLDETAKAPTWYRAAIRPALTAEQRIENDTVDDLTAARQIYERAKQTLSALSAELIVEFDDYRICSEIVSRAFPDNWQELCRKLGLI